MCLSDSVVSRDIDVCPSLQAGPWSVGVRPECIGVGQTEGTECSTAEVLASCVDVVFRNVQLTTRETNAQPTVAVESVRLAKLTLDDGRECTSDSFNANVNAGISQICKKVSPDFHASLYSFRHSWATIAQNGCGASLGDVDFALNHSTYKMARVYTKIDYSPAWELNEKVIDYIFFSNEEPDKNEDSTNSFERMSKYNLIRGEAFVSGERVSTIEDSGFTNVEQVITRLLLSLHEDVPRPTKVQIKISNLDKKQTRLYQRILK